tara:strand:+ start:287 stop:664 length:378 start_codon:yes stop_codon:yes gene_type:complete
MNTIKSKSVVKLTNNNGKISKNIEEMVYNSDTGKGFVNNNGEIYKFQKKPSDKDIYLIFSQKATNNDMKTNLQSILKNKTHYTPMFQTRKRKKVKKKRKRKKQKKTRKNLMKKMKKKMKTIFGSN